MPVPLPLMESIRKSLVRPSWMDSYLMMAMSQATYQEIALIAGIVTRVVVNNPSRWGLLFMGDVAVATPISVSPTTDPVTKGFTVIANLPDRRFTIFDYGPLVCMEWYANGPAGGTIGIWEITLEDTDNHELVTD